MDKNTWYRIWNSAVGEARLPFRYTPYQVRHTHASWLIDQGVDLGRVRATARLTARRVNGRHRILVIVIRVLAQPVGPGVQQ